MRQLTHRIQTAGGLLRWSRSALTPLAFERLGSERGHVFVMNLDDITLIVPTCNERLNVRAFLLSLPAELQVIAVDASDDDTPSLIHAIRPQNTRVIERRTDITHARQLGAEATGTPWLLLSDADVVFSLTYFAELDKLDAANPDLGLIFGTKKASDRFERYHRWFARCQRFFAALGIPAATGSNMLISRAAWQRVGGFDLHLRCNEDSEIAWRIARAGFHIHFAPLLSVYSHDHRRLNNGVTKKIAHSALRCCLLYFNLIPSRWRGRDWGYWSRPREAARSASSPSASLSAPPGTPTPWP